MYGFTSIESRLEAKRAEQEKKEKDRKKKNWLMSRVSKVLSSWWFPVCNKHPTIMCVKRLQYVHSHKEVTVYSLSLYSSFIPHIPTSPLHVHLEKACYPGSAASCSANDQTPGVPSPLLHLPLILLFLPHRNSRYVRTTRPAETHDSQRHKPPVLRHNTRAEICSFSAGTARVENRDITANFAKRNAPLSSQLFAWSLLRRLHVNPPHPPLSITCMNLHASPRVHFPFRKSRHAYGSFFPVSGVTGFEWNSSRSGGRGENCCAREGSAGSGLRERASTRVKEERERDAARVRRRGASAAAGRRGKRAAGGARSLGWKSKTECGSGRGDSPRGLGATTGWESGSSS